jgi:hypothetical protein
MSDLSEYYAKRYRVPKPKKEPKLHYVRWWDVGKVLCGKDVSALRTTNDPNKITCGSCKSSPHLDGMLGNMTHSGH